MDAAILNTVKQIQSLLTAGMSLIGGTEQEHAARKAAVCLYSAAFL